MAIYSWLKEQPPTKVKVKVNNFTESLAWRSQAILVRHEKILLLLLLLLLLFPMAGNSRAINLVPKKQPASWTISPVTVAPGASQGAVRATTAVVHRYLEPNRGDGVKARLAPPEVSFGNLGDIMTTTIFNVHRPPLICTTDVWLARRSNSDPPARCSMPYQAGHCSPIFTKGKP